MKRIETLGDFHNKENPETKVVEEIPNFTLEIANRLPAEKDIELQFDLQHVGYQDMMKKELMFSSKKEALVARDLLLEIKRLDELDENYTITYSPFTNTMLLKPARANSENQLFAFPGNNSYNYMVMILDWINKQEKYL